jgi:hypothetical protein
MISVKRDPGRPLGRVYLFGYRLHHGLLGAVMTALGLVLCWHDRRDAPWTRDIDPPRMDHAHSSRA